MKNLLLPLSFIFLSACATSVNVDYAPGTSFSGLKTFQVQAQPEAIPNDPRVNSPFMKQRITKAVGDQLTIKGMSFVKTSPDVIVKYHLGVRQELESDDSGVSIGFGTSSRHSAIGFAFGFPATEVDTIENLAITLDVVNAESKQVLWRGSLARQLYAGSTPESNTALINGMVQEILSQFPPR